LSPKPCSGSGVAVAGVADIASAQATTAGTHRRARSYIPRRANMYGMVRTRILKSSNSDHVVT
jgi:hypothetical protein